MLRCCLGAYGRPNHAWMPSLGAGLIRLSQGAAREATRAEQGQAVDANAAADAITDAVVAAPDAWRHLVGGGAADGATVTAGADAAPSPPATRSAMRAAAAAAAQLRASSG